MSFTPSISLLFWAKFGFMQHFLILGTCFLRKQSATLLDSVFVCCGRAFKIFETGLDWNFDAIPLPGFLLSFGALSRVSTTEPQATNASQQEKLWFQHSFVWNTKSLKLSCQNSFGTNDAPGVHLNKPMKLCPSKSVLMTPREAFWRNSVVQNNCMRPCDRGTLAQKPCSLSWRPTLKVLGCLLLPIWIPMCELVAFGRFLSKGTPPHCKDPHPFSPWSVQLTCLLYFAKMSTKMAAKGPAFPRWNKRLAFVLLRHKTINTPTPCYQTF